MIERHSLPSENHFARYCSLRLSMRNPPDSDNVVGFAPQAFRLRQFQDGVVEQELSGNHLEYFHAPDISQNVMALAKQLKEQRSLTIRSSGRFAVAKPGK
jgi:hypothetical protein